MLTRLWLRGLLTRRSGRLLGAVAGVMLTVALLASIGVFVAVSAASMTQRAVADVPVDWQVQLTPGTDVQGVIDSLGQATPYTGVAPVGYADAAGFTASSSGTVQTTGPGKVLGLTSRYQQQFPAELRVLLGSLDGVLVAQQTAANLNVTVGDSVAIQRVGLPAVELVVAGVVDLPNADSLFQAVGVPAGTAPQAPPDNVLLIPSAQWHQLFDAQAATRPDTVRTQLHVRLAHDGLPSDPGAAYALVQQRAHNLEARMAGSGLVGDNLLARLDGARADALYAQMLFLFLGLPGAVLAALLTLAVAASGSDRRRREQALLRTRGASTAQIVRLATLEALVAGAGGVGLGLGLAYLLGATIAPAGVPASSIVRLWTASAALAGLVLALAAVLVPTWLQARRSTVAAGRVVVGRPQKPLWQHVYLDVACLAVSAVAFWQVASSGYQVVLAPEGVAQSSVAYQAFLAPMGLWLGVGLLAMRLSDGGLNRGRPMLRAALRPIAGGLASVVAASMRRQRALVTRGVVLVGLAFAFATSTAVFNTTYNAQSHVDAELTNGADVTVTGSTASAPSTRLAELKMLSGVVAAQPMQHRFAYVGNDLQDLFGIDPAHLAEATTLADAYFASGDARTTLAGLKGRPDGLLVSAETAKDYQLQPGDQVNLRLQDAHDHQYRVVPFRFVGVVREFPTAPKDSFLVANASYIAQQTGSDAAEIVLLRTSSQAASVAGEARTVIGQLPGVRVTDIGSTQAVISSSLTAVDLRGLSQLELAFAVVLLAGATGLTFALGLAERQRTFAILAALGASGRQLSAFLWGEGLVILVGGSVVGVALGFAVAQMLVTLLTGVFDPPPESLAVPWAYLGAVAAAAVGATTLAIVGALAAARRPVVEAVRDL